MSVVYPVVRGSGPLLPVFAAVVLLGKRPGALGLVGAGVVVLGVLVIGLGTDGERRATGVSLLHGGLTGAAIAGYMLWDAYSVNSVGVPPLVYFTAGVVVQSLVLTPHAALHRAGVAALWRAHRRAVLGCGRVVTPGLHPGAVRDAHRPGQPGRPGLSRRFQWRYVLGQ